MIWTLSQDEHGFIDMQRHMQRLILPIIMKQTEEQASNDRFVIEIVFYLLHLVTFYLKFKFMNQLHTRFKDFSIESSLQYTLLCSKIKIICDSNT